MHGHLKAENNTTKASVHAKDRIGQMFAIVASMIIERELYLLKI